MNQLRNLRKKREKNKQKRTKIKSLVLKVCLLLFNLIFATFAWVIYSIILEPNIDVNIAAWKVDFKNNQESLANTLQFNVDNFYPGMDEQTKEIEIINLGEKKANITYTVEKLELLGKEYQVKEEPSEGDGPNTLYYSTTTEDNTTVVKLFNDEKKYPFEILLTYTQIIYTEEDSKSSAPNEDGEGAPEEGIVLSNVGNFEIKLIWGYNTVDDNDEESEERNILDTKWGYDIANYYNSLEEGSNKSALEMALKVYARQIIE